MIALDLLNLAAGNNGDCLLVFFETLEELLGQLTGQIPLGRDELRAHRPARISDDRDLDRLAFF